MYFIALAADYDGTIAEDGTVHEATLVALKEVKASGRKLILVTGRDLRELLRVFPALDLFDLAVVENGALLYDPGTKVETPLSSPPDPEFVRQLQARRVEPLSVGRGIVATWRPNESVVLEVIRDLGLELQITFNKGAVMVLPAGINKASGLRHALERLKLSPHNVVGIGDAENDHAMLKLCGCSVAVDNAIPSIKETADLQVPARGAGVVALCRQLVDTDLRASGSRVPKASPVVGQRADGSSLHITTAETILVTGASGGGKSTTVTALLEQIRDLSYQFCVVDPEGDYGEFEGAVVLGDAKHPPGIEEIMGLLQKPGISVFANLLAIDPADRPGFLTKLLPELTKLRATTGRPHWIVLDEAHHCLPAAMGAPPFTLPKNLPATIAVTVHPESVARDFLELVSMVIGVGTGAGAVIGKFCETAGWQCSIDSVPQLGKGQVQVVHADGRSEVVAARRPSGKKQRHARKYAEGELGEDRSFYFRGPDNALKLRAQNLMLFLQLADGVDDATWLHHLRGGDYSRWFREAIKDDDLAVEAEQIEADGSDAAGSRAAFREVVEKRYTAPAKG